MAFQTIWYETQLPKNIIDEIEKTLSAYPAIPKQSEVDRDILDTVVRNSKNLWVPDSCWISSFLWYYVEKANKENFMYDIFEIENASMQYTTYEKNDFYIWHSDNDLSDFYKPCSLGVNMFHNTNEKKEDLLNRGAETVRKLSLSLQLSEFDEYEGGNLEFKDIRDRIHLAPRTRGSIIIFDSRTIHRVTPVTKGIRKSLVCWIHGPRWK